MSEISIKPAIDPADVAQVRELMRAYGDYLSASPNGAANICLEGFAKELEELPQPYLALLLATVNGAPAGCAALKSIQSAAVPETRACELKRLWVGAGFRGFGLGRRLMEETLAWARREGFTAMYLDTVPAAMPEANALYQRMGFERVERYNRNPLADVVFYRLSIEPDTAHA